MTQDQATTVSEPALGGPAEFRQMAIDRLVESAHNPRKHFDPQKLEELTASVRTSGVITPLIVRPHPKRKGRGTRTEGMYEIGAGHRRFRAATAAGLLTVPVIVRELSDEQFTELLNLENLQREDLNALEEAEGYRQLQLLPGWDVDTVALRVSRSKKYVYDRIKLLELIAPLKKHLVDGTITVGHAILIARHPDEQQKLVLENGLFEHEHIEARLRFDDEEKDKGPLGDGPRKVVSIRQLEGWIDQHLRLDRSAVDPMVHPELHQNLYSLQAAEEPVKVIPITYLHQVPKTAKDDERTLCRLSWTRADGEIDHEDWAYSGKRKPSKTCEYSGLGVIVVGPGRGDSFKVCTDKKKCRVHWPEKKKAKGSALKAAEKREAKQLEEHKRQEAKREQEREAWKKVLPHLHRALVEKVETAGCGTNGPLAKLIRDRYGIKKIEGTSAEDLVRSLAKHALEWTIDHAAWQGEKYIAPLAKTLSVDLKALRKQHAPKAAVQTSAPKEKRAKGAAKKTKSAKPKRKPAVNWATQPTPYLATPMPAENAPVRTVVLPAAAQGASYKTCRKCGCTDDDCSQCVARTGVACTWVAPDLCSACEGEVSLEDVPAHMTATRPVPPKRRGGLGPRGVMTTALDVAPERIEVEIEAWTPNQEKS